MPDRTPLRLAEELAEMPGLIPVLPMLYIVWADGILTPTELAHVQTLLQDQSWLSASEKTLFASWLDPGNPPTPVQLKEWRKLIQDAARHVPPGAKSSLTDFGIELSELTAPDGSPSPFNRQTRTALRTVESLLGIPGSDAVRHVLHDQQPAPKQETARPEPAFRPRELQRYLDAPYARTRQKVRMLLKDPFFAYLDDPDRADHREHVLDWCREIAKHGFGAYAFPKAYGGKNDIGAFITVFETLAYHDLSLVVKFGVQFGLFAGSILNLGTKKHHDAWLSLAGSLELPGCFAMTEAGHGSNVRDLETTATWSQEHDGFVVHTPTEAAHKEYIGNAAQHGRLATVFAQLIIDGERYGVHAFLVPLRDHEGRVLEGVRIEDTGSKMGLNGVDNGRIWFDKVRIPRDNLLDKFALVAPDGSYSSEITSPSARFFTMLGTLVGGRISVAAASVSASKSALAIAIRYAARRRQFGDAGQPESLIIDYPSHQKRLFPLLANVFALDATVKSLIGKFAKRTPDNSREIETLAAGVKAWASWNATHTIQTAREACGGRGYLSENRIPALKADSDIFTTFEGDNTVLLQLVAKGLLSELREDFEEMKFFGLVRYLSENAATALRELNPIIVRNTDRDHLRDPGFHEAAFRYREEHLLVTVAKRLKKRIENGMSSYNAFIACQNHLVGLAMAHVERVMLESFRARIPICQDAASREALERVYGLFALSRLHEDRAWFLENGYIEGNKAKAIRKEVIRQCAEMRGDAVGLVDSFGIPDELLAAPIAVQPKRADKA